MKEFLGKLKELNLPKGKFAIFGGGPMCVRGLRECRDLDVIVTERLFNNLKEKKGLQLKKEEFCDYLEKDGVEFYKDWGPGEWDIEKLIQGAEIIDDLPFIGLEQVLKWKKINKRDKDIEDIKLIEEYLNKN